MLNAQSSCRRSRTLLAKKAIGDRTEFNQMLTRMGFMILVKSLNISRLRDCLPGFDWTNLCIADGASDMRLIILAQIPSAIGGHALTTLQMPVGAGAVHLRPRSAPRHKQTD